MSRRSHACGAMFASIRPISIQPSPEHAHLRRTHDIADRLRHASSPPDRATRRRLSASSSRARRLPGRARTPAAACGVRQPDGRVEAMPPRAVAQPLRPAVIRRPPRASVDRRRLRSPLGRQSTAAHASHLAAPSAAGSAAHESPSCTRLGLTAASPDEPCDRRRSGSHAALASAAHKCASTTRACRAGPPGTASGRAATLRRGRQRRRDVAERPADVEGQVGIVERVDVQMLAPPRRSARRTARRRSPPTAR